MWTNLRTFSSMLTFSLISYVIFQTVQADDLDLLRNIFADAVARDVTSLETMATALKPDWAETLKISSWTSACLNSTNDFDALKNCLRMRSKCMSLKDVSNLFNLTASQSLSSHDVSSTAPALLYSLLSCSDENLEELAVAIDKKGKPASEASWGYSFLFVTLINLASLTGAIVLPCMRFKSYKLVLMFMVALAVGTLAGSGLLFLLPEAFLLVHEGDTGYIWKSSTIMGGIYLFYVTEKIMRMINARKENTSLKKQRDEMATKGTITTSFRRIPVDNSIPQKDPSHIPGDIGGMCSTHSHSNTSSRSSSSEVANSYEQRNEGDKGNVEMDIDVIAISGGGGGDMLLPGSEHEKTVSNGSNSKHSHHHHHHHHHASEIAPVAYMIIFGDALHNFIDGLSIGSAFTQSIMTGVSVSVAVLCEELPHELGDFAILLNSGMRFKKAIMYNFLSACTCYIGTVIGILLGENTSSHEWIFAVAGGMFLYISLVDMMPEMNSAAESEEGRQFGEIKTFLLQNAGLLTGFGIMLVFAVFGGNIKFD